MSRKHGLVGTVALVAAALASAFLVPSAAAAGPSYTAFVLDGDLGASWSNVEVLAAPDATFKLYAAGDGFSMLATLGNVNQAVTLVPPTGQQFAVGTYPVTNAGDATHAGVNNPSCNNLTTGTLNVRAVTLGADGAPTSIAADYAVRCTTEPLTYGQVRYHSSIPYAALTSGPLAFDPNQQVGATSTRPVTIDNIGAAPVDLGAATLLGPNAAEYSVSTAACPATLAAGANCTINVTSAPYVLGALTATLQIADSTPRGDLQIPITQVVQPNADGTMNTTFGSRLVDTRHGGKTEDGKEAGQGPLAPGETRVVQVAGRPGIPTAAHMTAALLNITVVRPTSNGYLTLFPYGSARPTASSINFVHGETRANLVTVPLDALGRISVYNPAGSTDVLVDIAGVYNSASGFLGSVYVPITPTRILDTRVSGGKLPAGYYLSLSVSEPANAVALNVTVTGASGSGYLAAWPSSGNNIPQSSALDFRAGQTVSNAVVVGTDPERSGEVFSIGNFGSRPVHVIVDLLGVYEYGVDGMHFHPVTPHRIVDTRSALGLAGPLGPQQDGVVSSGIGDTHTHALVMNVTGVHPTAATYLSFTPGTTAGPTSSSVNLAVGTVVANMAVVGLDDLDRFNVYNSAGSVDVLADVSGYFDGPGTATLGPHESRLAGVSVPLGWPVYHRAS